MRIDDSPSRALTAKYKKRRPSERTCGKRCENSARAGSRAVTGLGVPPRSGTWERPPIRGGNRITPSELQVPPNATPASQITCAGPPEISILFSFPREKNSNERPSGDQNG